MELPTAPGIDELRTRAFDGLVCVVERAQAVGVLRADVTHPDFVLLLMANAGLLERAVGLAPEASARLIQVLLDGLRADAATDRPLAPDAEQVAAAMRANGGRRLGAIP